MPVVKNGTSRHDLKAWMTSVIAPKYFSEIENLSDLNVGLFGYTTDIMSDAINDGFFSVASLYKEIYPQLAELPESIYNHALLYNLNNIFAKPASANFTLMIAEDTVMDASTAGDGNYVYFDIDSNTVFMIEGMSFMMDYDVEILSKETSTGILHSAKYLMNHENSLSDLMNPYIRTGIYTNTNGKRYIMLAVKVRQVTRTVKTEIISDNSEINVVSKEFPFTGNLANFEVYYRTSSSPSYVQLKKQLVGLNKLEGPFCFYKLKDDTTLRLEFSDDDRFFQPEYLSELQVEIFTTLGSEGNFQEYEGDDIRVIGNSDKYSSNRGVVFMGNITGSSVGGTDRQTLEELRNETIKARSTIKSFTTPNDLNLYFDSIREISGKKSRILFMKKRDDCFQRLYSAFILFRDPDGRVIPTNTLDIIVNTEDIDYSLMQTARNVVKAGKLYKYIADVEAPYAMYMKDVSFSDNLDVYEGTDTFVYVNPFLTIVGTNPLQVSFYLNTIDETLSLFSEDINAECFDQFIVNNIQIKRNGIDGDDYYTFRAALEPTTVLPQESFTLIEDDTRVTEDMVTFKNDYDGYNYINNGNIKAVLELQSASQTMCYVMMDLVGFDDNYYYVEGKIKTNDYISMNHDMQIVEGHLDVETFEKNQDPVMVPSIDCRANLYTFYKYNDGTEPKEHLFKQFAALADYTMTNKYIVSEDNLINFVVPIQEIQSYVDYMVREVDGSYGFRIDKIPLVKANYMKIPSARKAFFDEFHFMYNYIDAALDQITNNYDVDLKFFNTYGFSEHYFLAGSDETHIDKVNIELKYKVKLSNLSNKEEVVKDLTEFIQNFVETDSLSLVSSPSFYNSALTKACMDKFASIKYMDLIGINDYPPTIQSLESNVNEVNIIQGIIVTSDIIPEYLNIDMVIKDGYRTPMLNIEVL